MGAAVREDSGSFVARRLPNFCPPSQRNSPQDANAAIASSAMIVLLEGQLRVYHLVNALSTDFCQPLFYGFCFF